MKTIFIIVSGIADIPDLELEGRTPLMLAATPSLDALAKCGCCGSIMTVADDVPLTKTNAILSLLGFDFRKTPPSGEELDHFGRSESVGEADKGIDYFVIPKFSGHGVVISAHPAIRGIGKMALLTPLDMRTCHFDGDNMLRGMADAAIEAIEDHEFVLLHVECAASMSRKGDLKGKIRAIENIDADVITPIADYVWNAKLQMNMVVVPECVMSWRSRGNERGEVPAVVYFNDDPPYNMSTFDEESVVDGPLNTPLPGDLIRKLVTFEPYSVEEM